MASLWRETGLDTSVIHSFCEIFLYDLLNKIETPSLRLIYHLIVFHNVLIL